MIPYPTHDRGLVKSSGDFFCLDIFFFLVFLIQNVEFRYTSEKAEQSLCYCSEGLQFLRMQQISSIQARGLAGDQLSLLPFYCPDVKSTDTELT